MPLMADYLTKEDKIRYVINLTDELNALLEVDVGTVLDVPEIKRRVTYIREVCFSYFGD